MQTTDLSLDTLRRLALMQHLGEDYFIIDGIAYEGNKDDVRSEFEDKGGDLYDQSFEDYCKENCIEVEELEEDDYSIDYMVLTDEEADAKWEESLDSYLEECVYPELKKIGDLARYFDDEAWKKDARYDGRGHSLSSYDGNEYEVIVEGETFYIYRIN